MHPFVSSLFCWEIWEKRFCFHQDSNSRPSSTVLDLCLKTTKSGYEIWVKVVFMNWSNNEHRKGCILMGKFFFQVFKLRDKNSNFLTSLWNCCYHFHLVLKIFVLQIYFISTLVRTYIAIKVFFKNQIQSLFLWKVQILSNSGIGIQCISISANKIMYKYFPSSFT